MNPLAKALFLSLFSFASACSTAGVTGQVGFTNVAVSGDVGLTSGTGGVTATAHQDIESAFGLGSDQGSPYLRAQIDLGVPVFTASGFMFSEKGSGVLAATFGGLSSSTAVDTSLDFANLKLSSTFDIGLGPVKVSPGLAVDVFDINFKATEMTLGNSEQIDQIVPVPLLFVRGEVDALVCNLVAEAGYLSTPKIGSSKGSCLDIEAMAEWSVLPMVELFAGYRRIDIDWKGETSSDSFDVNMTVDGWLVGGGVRF